MLSHQHHRRIFFHLHKHTHTTEVSNVFQFNFTFVCFIFNSLHSIYSTDSKIIAADADTLYNNKKRFLFQGKKRNNSNNSATEIALKILRLNWTKKKSILSNHFNWIRWTEEHSFQWMIIFRAYIFWTAVEKLRNNN